MKRRVLISLAVVCVVLLVWFGSSSEQRSLIIAAVTPAAAPSKAPAAKPVCSQVIVPAGVDCIPQHLAHLPPDPGPTGKLTIEGIDSDKDGVRDDVQRYIAEKYGHSQRAVKALTLLAVNAQMYVKVGDSMTRDEVYELIKDNHAASCYARSVDSKIISDRALDYVVTLVTNTPERFKRWSKFQNLAANRVYLMPDLEEPLEKLCGYDPAKLPN